METATTILAAHLYHMTKENYFVSLQILFIRFYLFNFYSAFILDGTQRSLIKHLTHKTIYNM